jgi:hypothetical protein
VAGRQDGELGDLGPGHLTGLGEHIGDDLLGIAGAPDRLREPVEKFQARVTLTQCGVRAVRDAQDHRDDHEQHCRAGIDPEDDHRHEPDTRIEHCANERDARDGPQLTDHHAVLMQPDDHADRDDADGSRGDRGNHRRDPERRTEPQRASGYGVKDEDGDAILECEVAQVEHQLEESLPADQHQDDAGPDQVSDEKMAGTDEHQPEHEWNLVQRH